MCSWLSVDTLWIKNPLSRRFFSPWYRNIITTDCRLAIPGSSCCSSGKSYFLVSNCDSPLLQLAAAYILYTVHKQPRSTHLWFYWLRVQESESEKQYKPLGISLQQTRSPDTRRDERCGGQKKNRPWQYLIIPEHSWPAVMLIMRLWFLTSC
jgi:hypothetical protein